jgi:hypothetical protein
MPSPSCVAPHAQAQKMLAPAEDDGFGFSPSDDRPDEDTRRKKADLAAATEMEIRRKERAKPYVKQMVQHQWTKIWLRQQDIKQIEAGDFSCVNFAPLQPFLAPPSFSAGQPLDCVAVLSRVCVCSDIVSGAAAWAREPPPVSGHTCTA